jgi:hypothetical protein
VNEAGGDVAKLRASDDEVRTAEDSHAVRLPLNGAGDPQMQSNFVGGLYNGDSGNDTLVQDFGGTFYGGPVNDVVQFPGSGTFVQ